MYEGVTEYTAHHVQVKYGLTSIPQFLDELSKKITSSRRGYNDTLPFTKMSKESAGKYAKQYGNVYQKGALIAACLDIYLLHLSGGTYSLRNLTYDLGIRYGKKRYFNDEELFRHHKRINVPGNRRFPK
jgi:predicted metalloprotease with PDZ domain